MYEKIGFAETWIETTSAIRKCRICDKVIKKGSRCLVHLDVSFLGKKNRTYCPACSEKWIQDKSAELRKEQDLYERMMMSLFLEKYGIGCDTCNHYPTNHGQRETCWRYVEKTCTEENGYQHYYPLPLTHKFPKYAC